MTNLERYQILSQPYISSKEIMSVTGFKANKTSELVSEIIACANAAGKKLLYERGRVPAKMVIERLEIDINEIFDLALKEKQLGI